MKYLFYSFLFLNVWSIRSQDIHAYWAKEPIEINNGNLSEWSENGLQFFDNKTNFLYGVFNDSTNLYLVFKTGELASQIRFTQLGMLLELNIKTYKKHSLYLEFPFDIKDKENVFKSSDVSNIPNPSSFNTKDKKYALYYKKNEDKKQTFSLDSGDVKIKVSWDKNKAMAIQLTIPLQTICNSDSTDTDILSAIRECEMEVTLNSFDRSSIKVNSKTAEKNVVELDAFEKSNGGKSAGSNKNFRKQYDKFTQENIIENRNMYNKAAIKQSISLATSPLPH